MLFLIVSLVCADDKNIPTFPTVVSQINENFGLARSLQVLAQLLPFQEATDQASGLSRGMNEVNDRGLTSEFAQCLMQLMESQYTATNYEDVLSKVKQHLLGVRHTDTDYGQNYPQCYVAEALYFLFLKKKVEMTNPLRTALKNCIADIKTLQFKHPPEPSLYDQFMGCFKTCWGIDDSHPEKGRLLDKNQ